MTKDFFGQDRNGVDIYKFNSKRVCSIDGCFVKHNKQGYCGTHYKEFKETRRCVANHCGEKVFSQLLCSKHHKQYYRHGDLIGRTIYDANEITIYEDYAEMKLYNKQGAFVASTLIDLEDIASVKKYKWHLNDNGYVRNKVINDYLHRYILNAKIGDVDHKNSNPLDNRKSNLRECTHADNNKNTKSINSKSGLKGVYFHKAMKKWYSTIGSDNVSYTSLFFENMEDANESREKMELFLYEEFSSRYSYLQDKYGVVTIETFNELVGYTNVLNKKGEK